MNSLVESLPDETIDELAELIHDRVCADHLEDDFEEMDDDEHDECLSTDLETVIEILGVLQTLGVSYSPMFIPRDGEK